MFKRYLLHPAIFFACTSLIFLWPLSGLFFSVKNDALTYYYPVRTLIADAVRNGELPLWTAFINMGYPLHADMQSSAWNPITWLFGLLTNYSLAAFHYEAIFYFAVAGAGFYYLARHLGCNKIIALTIGAAYQFSGFMVDSVQFFNCLPSAAILPFIILFTRRLTMDKLPIDAVALGAMFYLLFTGGYPSLFIISAYVVATWLLFAFFSSNEKQLFLRTIAAPLFLSCLVFVLLSAPAIVSFWQHLPLISRGHAQSLSFVQENSMNPGATLSLLTPFATTAKESWMNSDVIMRNLYIGIIPLVFAGLALTNRNCFKKKEFRFFFLMFLLTLGLAFGKHFFLRAGAFHVLPLMDSFRHPALFRLFSILFLLLMAAEGMKEIDNDRIRQLALRKFIPALAVLLVVAMIVVTWPQIIKNAATLKWNGFSHFFANYNFSHAFVLQGPIAILFLSLTYYAIRNRKHFLLLGITIADLFIATQLNLPVTVIGAKKFSEVERLLNRNSEAFPLPNTLSIAENSRGSQGPEVITGSTLPFTKKIGRNDYYISPGNLFLQDSFYESPLKKVVFKLPPAFLLYSPQAEVSKLSAQYPLKDSIEFTEVSFGELSANKSSIAVTAKKPGTLVYLQNNYPGWEAYEDGRRIPIQPAFLTFMSVPISEGAHEIEFHYLPRFIHYCFAFSVLSMISVLLYVVLYFLKQRRQRNAT